MDRRRKTSTRVNITSGVIGDNFMPSCSGKGVGKSETESPEITTKDGPPDDGADSQSSHGRSLMPGGRDSLSVTFLQGLRTLAPSDIINLLSDSKELLEELLDSDIKDNEMDLLVRGLAQACNYPAGPEKIREILKILQRKDFVEVSLTPWIARWKCNTHLSDIHKENFGATVCLLTGFVEEVPESIASIKVISIILKRIFQTYDENDVQLTPKVSSAMKDLLEINSRHAQSSQNPTQCKARVSKVHHEDAPNDFRNISILPTSEELQSDFKPFLRTNIVNGSYENVHHYLDVHFRLLREDFVQPLREGIAEYTTEINRGEKSQVKSMQSLHVYHNVRAVDVTPCHGDMVYVLQFDIDTNVRRVKWEFSKKLLYGSLVCLSRDGFQKLIFGVVANSDPRKLRQGIVEVTFEISEDISRDLFLYPYKMVESSSYFEAYRHVLECLQTIDEEHFPFKQYLISIPNAVNLPKYIRENPDVKLSLSSYCHNKEKVDSPWKLVPRWLLDRTNVKQVNVREENEWPSADELGLDESQKEAFKAALTEELCLIQGPPGTGKTHVGLKIVETLLRNNHCFDINGPLLVVCYTNHALDQFLEGILDTTHTRVVRIGGRSSSDKMKDLNINKIARERSIGNKFLRREYSIAKSNLKTCASKLQHIKYSIDVAGKKILKYRFLSEDINFFHRRSFLTFKDDILARWLGIIDGRGRIIDAFVTENSHLVRSEKVSKRIRLEDESSQSTPKDNFSNDGMFYSENDELERRYLEDEDDFFRSMMLTDYLQPEYRYITVELQEYYVDKRGRRVRQICSLEHLYNIIQAKLSEVNFMTQEEVDSIDDVWVLDVERRWRLYRFWVKKFVERSKLENRAKHLQLVHKSKEFKAVILRERLVALSGISVIGVTTTGAAKNQELLKGIAPSIVIIEEAAEIFEAHVITSLSANCQHLILIGDHQQLRPNPAVYKLCKDYKLDVSLFERLINNGMPCHRLSLQHRMRPEISHLLKIHKDFYPGLLDHEMVKSYDHVRGIEKDVYFIEHDYPEQQNDESKSRSNTHEAVFITALCKYLLQQGYKSEQITILTAYQGQVRNFMHFREIKSPGGFRVCPIDNFQGEENDIILISFVRSNQEGNIGFLKVSNRVCVALSRAKKGLYCIGNFTLMAEKSDLWKVIVDDLRKRDLIGPKLTLMCRNHPDRSTKVSCASDFKEVPDGGCSESCNARLNCGHTCQKKCHPEDKEHQNVSCMKPCEKKCDANSHQCRRRCSEPCRVFCREQVKKVLPCSHEMSVDCSRPANEVRCRSNCEKLLPCGHRCQSLCCEECTDGKCSVEISKTFEPCGHEATVQCSERSCPQKCRALLKCKHVCSGTCGKCRNNRFHVKCERRCQRILVCGHVCESKCSSTCPPCRKPCKNGCQHNECKRRCGKSCTPCTEPCLRRCRHMRCAAKCGDDCDRKPCNEPCEVKLECGHPCIGLCGEPCPALCRVCNDVNVTRILFGNEDESGAMFISLEECRHIVEVKAMDHLMTICNSSDQEIKLPECPWCKTPIRFNPRYNNIIKAIRRDVEQVKRHILDRGESFDERFSKLKLRIDRKRFCASTNVGFAMPMISHTNESNGGGKSLNLQTITDASIRMCMNIEKNIENQKILTMRDLSKAEMQLDMFEKLQNLYQTQLSELDENEMKFDEIDAQLNRFREDYSFLLTKTKSLAFVTEQEIEDWQREYKRCRFTIDFARVLKAFRQPGVKPETLKKENEMLEEVKTLLSDGEKLSDEKESKVGGILKELNTQNPLLASIGITEDERDMVVKAMGFTRGHWFKCPNGHVYAIGECGGAMQRSQCPECNVSIGGESHRLDEGNVVASEMDGALHPAYSEEANNMMNFEELM